MKKIAIILLYLSIFTLITACSNSETAKKSKENSVQISADSPYPITITDFYNKKTIVNKKPEKIIVLSPSAAEIIFNMGFGKNIIGISEECNYPKELSKLQKVGSYSNIDVELIRKLNPDLIFTGKYVYQNINNIFIENALPVVYVDSDNYTGIYETIDIIGRIFDEKAKAENIKNSLKNKVDNILTAESSERPKVLYIQSVNPIFAAGAKTLINDIIYLSGGANAALKVEGYSAVEDIQKDVDFILLSSKLSEEVNLQYLERHYTFKDITAVKNKKVFRLSNEDIFTTPGLRIYNAIEEVAEIIQQNT